MKSRLLTIAALGLLVLQPAFSNTITKGGVTISRVSDGDTYWIKADRITDWKSVTSNAKKGTFNLSEKTFKARILNINTEESVHRTKSKNTTFGKETSALVKKELNGKRVAFVCIGVGKYGRPLCSVYVFGMDYGLSLADSVNTLPVTVATSTTHIMSRRN